MQQNSSAHILSSLNESDFDTMLLKTIMKAKFLN